MRLVRNKTLRAIDRLLVANCLIVDDIVRSNNIVRKASDEQKFIENTVEMISILQGDYAAVGFCKAMSTYQSQVAGPKTR